MLTDSESMRVDRGIINILTKTKPWVKYSAQRPKLAQILRSQKPGWSNLVAALNQQRCQLSKPKDFLIKPYLLWRALVKIRRRFCKNFVFCILFQIFFCPLWGGLMTKQASAPWHCGTQAWAIRVEVCAKPCLWNVSPSIQRPEDSFPYWRPCRDC